MKWLGNSPDIFTDNSTRSNATNDSRQWQSETRECVNGICPVQPSKGEEIKHDCGNINNFAEVISAMSAVAELAEDMICGSL